MAYPTFEGKHEHPAVVTPDHDAGTDEDVPEAVIVCYQNSLLDHVVAEHADEEISVAHSLYEFRRLDDRPRVGVVGRFGIGAPTTVMTMEMLAAQGVESSLSAGYAGSLQRDIAMEDVVVPDEAIRDEGTSHHYLAPGTYVEPTPSLAADAREAAERSDRTVHRGTTWTIDAAYRETVAEVEHYTDRGVLTVEMEASATFAVARYRGFEAASLFVVSDYLGTEEWDPQFHRTQEHLEDLFGIAVDALERHVGE